MAERNVPPSSPIGRVLWPNVFEPSEYKGKSRYQVTVVFDPKELSSMVAAGLAALKQKFGDKAPKSFKREDWPDQGWYNPFAKCDGEFEGLMKVRFKSKFPPSVYGPDKRPIPASEASAVYSGCYGRVAYSAYAYDNDGKGVMFQLEGFQKARDGEPISGRGDVEAAFDEIETANAELPATSDMFA